jgi:hypothetical protein
VLDIEMPVMDGITALAAPAAELNLAYRRHHGLDADAQGCLGLDEGDVAGRFGLRAEADHDGRHFRR